MAEDRHDHIEPDLIPSALRLRLMPGPSASDWQVTRCYPDTVQPPQFIASPCQRDHAFLQTLRHFWRLSRQMLAEASAVEMLHTHAAAVGDQLANVLTAQDRVYLTTPAADGITPCLIIESADEMILSLPWELLRLQDRFAVRDGLLDVVRSIPIDAPSALPQASGPLTLLMTVAAPEPGTLLNEDEERYRLLRAVPAPITSMLNETGEFEELLASVSAAPPMFGIHFSGQADGGSSCLRTPPVRAVGSRLRTCSRPCERRLRNGGPCFSFWRSNTMRHRQPVASRRMSSPGSPASQPPPSCIKPVFLKSWPTTARCTTRRRPLSSLRC